MESLPRTEAPPSAVDAATPSDRPEPHGPPHLADPRALQILSTEHWGQLTARSLVYNETFARGSMFLTFLSASLVALGFVYQGSGPDFVYILIAILALDLFVGLTTLGRLASAGYEEMRALQAMNRIRHAYLEMVPGLAPYFSTSPHDDMRGVVATYWAVPSSPAFLPNVTHGLGTLGAAVAFIIALLTGAIAGLIALQLGATGPATAAAGVLVFVLCMLAEFALGYRRIQALDARFEVRFPSPPSGPADTGGSG